MSDSILPDRPAIDDEFDRKPFAERVAAAILTQQQPDAIVIGLYAPWGDGKSTVLNFIEATLGPQCFTIKFNPWRFKSADDLLPVFFNTLAEVLNERLGGTGRQIGKVMQKYSKYYLPASAVLKAVTGIDAGGAADAATKELSAVDLEKDKADVDTILRESGKKIVVIMDDIDRLDATEIQAVFKMIKLTADFSNMVYLLAFDDDIVAAALSRSYASGNRDDGRNFLEKIVQVPLHLPRISDDMRSVHFFLGC